MNQDNKKITLIIYIIMLIIAIGGVSIAIYEKDHDLFGDEYIEIEHDDDDYEDNYDDEYEYDEEDDEEEEPVIPDPIIPDEPNNNMDEYLEQIDFVVASDTRKDLINSTNCIECSSSAIHGEMFKEDISDNYKLLYTVHEMWGYLEDNYEKIENYQPLYGDVTISEKVLLSNAKKIFKDVEIPTYFDTNLFYMGTSALTCNNGTCTFNQTTFGLTGVSPFFGYETKIEQYGNDFKVQQIYLEDEYIEFDEEKNKYIFNIKLYDTKGGNLIKELNEYEIDLDKQVDAISEFSQYYNEINTYIFKFDENNTLIEVEKE